MYKQILSLFTILALSALIVMFMPQAKQALDLLVSAHNHISTMLTEVFQAGPVGNILRGLIALMAIPVLAGLLPSLLYLLIRKHWSPYFMEIVWIVWLIQAGALIVGGAVPAVA